ncbi:hypothetical protein GCM10027093_69800 [Paraburkholderia jirisanensis]
MTANTRPMRCGSCGTDLFRLSTADETAALVVECIRCHSISYLKPEAKLLIEWDDDRHDRIGVF